MNGQERYSLAVRQMFQQTVDVLDDVNDEDEMERQAFGIFVFGMMNSLAQQMQATPVQVQAETIAFLTQALGYSPQQAMDFSMLIIQATKEENNPNWNAIIHRGIEGHRQLQQGQKKELDHNFKEIMEVLRKYRDR